MNIHCKDWYYVYNCPTEHHTRIGRARRDIAAQITKRSDRERLARDALGHRRPRRVAIAVARLFDGFEHILDELRLEGVDLFGSQRRCG